MGDMMSQCNNNQLIPYNQDNFDEDEHNNSNHDIRQTRKNIDKYSDQAG